jgi:photosystem II stability/assembly factor-like uncharacterized protein
LTWQWFPVKQWGEGFFSEVQFLSLTRGYVLARQGSCAGLIQTTDGGAIWTQVYPRPRPCGPGLDDVPVQFVDAQHGFASGTYLDPGAILATADAGDNWQQIASLPGQAVRSLRFTDAMHGWANAEDSSWNGVRTTFETADGGHTWKPVASSNRGNFSVPPVKGQFGWKLEDGTIMATVDAGQSWSEIPMDYRAVGFSGLPDGHAWVIIAQNCVARDCVQLIFSTTDGKTWTRSDFGQAKDVIATWLTFVDDNHGWLLDDLGRLYRTVNGGQTWTELW